MSENNIENCKKIKKISATLQNESIVSEIKKLQVCAYVRVSTNSDEQEDSFDRQVEYYTQYIRQRDDWEFVGIYTDAGITGTSANKRREFKRMLDDCRAGKIDKILCKSIARFARNAADTLKYLMELKELGISVVFETQNIDTMTAGGEVLTTVLAALAEQESRTLSTNVKWAIQKKFQNGEIMLNYTNFLGYTRDENINLVVVPEQAVIVRRIYKKFLYGYSATNIANRLNADCIPTPSGKVGKWSSAVVLNILQNEKYHGDAILGKTYKLDVLSKKRYANHGQSEMYYVENSHPAIISKEDFDLVQAELRNRQHGSNGSKTDDIRYSSKYAFSKKFICGECGGLYRRYAQTIKGEYVPTWVCATHKLKGIEACSQQSITERILEDAFTTVVGELLGDITAIKRVLEENILSSLDDGGIARLETVLDEINKYQTEMLEIHRQRFRDEISLEDYNKKANIISTAIEQLNKEKTVLETQVHSVRMTRKRVENILEFLSNIDPTKNFDADLFKILVENVLIKPSNEIQFNFKVGISHTYRLKSRK